MPRKNGFAALGLIKRSTELQDLPVIIFSTASGGGTIRKVFRDAAHYYMCKPADFSQLKKMIYEALMLISQKDNTLPNENNFMITGDSITIPNKK
jgi:CheY-like chemotaxis protein